jgi:cysteine desulfurase
MSERSVYLDYAATTPVDPRVAEVMAACLRSDRDFGNPSSAHCFGREAARIVAAARAEVAGRIGAPSESIVFTSGATEANNLALCGAARIRWDRGRHLVTARTEHKSVLDTAAALEQEGFSVTYLDCGADGRIDPAALVDALTDETTVVSLMHVNNETGVVQDIAALGAVCRERGLLFHVDAAQSVGKLELAVAAWPVDLVSLTAHKLCGPKGVGALYIRPGTVLAPILHGGDQERGLRPGTIAVHQVVGMGQAYALADPAVDGPHAAALTAQLWQQLSRIHGARRNGAGAELAPHVLNVAFPGVSGESLRLEIAEIAVSAGSACTAETLESSHVLTAMGLSDTQAESSLRFSVGRYTTDAEIDYVAVRVAEAVARLRALAPGAPLWCTR